MRVGRILMVVLALAVAAAIPAHATLLDGQTVRVTYEYPVIGTVFSGASYDVLVGPGVEIAAFPTPGDNVTSVDLSDTNILVGYNSNATFLPASFNGFHVFDAFGTIPAFTSVSINPASTLVGFDVSRITFDADNIWVNWQNLPFNTETVLSLDLTAEAGAVPEPSTLMLIGLGIPGLVRAARRRSRS